MTQQEQTVAFANDLDRLVTRYEQEFQLSAAASIGVLSMKIFAIQRAVFEDAEDDDESESGG